MDKKLYNTWMTVASVALGIIGLVFILVSIFDKGATRAVLIIGLLFVEAGSLFNASRKQQDKKDREE